MREGWDERLGWALGLISDDPSCRERAHLMLEQVRLDRYEAWRRSNAVRNEPGNEALHEQHRQTRLRLLPDAIWASWRPDEDLRSWPGLPYMLLYLQWEARFPNEWTWHAKEWSSKTSMLRLLTRRAGEIPDRYVGLLADLVVQAASRPQRLGDEWYAKLARVLPREPLSGQLQGLLAAGDAVVRERAGYLLWLLDDPRRPQPKFSQWQRYLREQHGRGEHTRVRGRRTPAWFQYQHVVLVRCPHCVAQATVSPDEHEGLATDATWHAACAACGYSEHRSGWTAIRRPAGGEAYGPIFGHPLWLQARCCGDNLLKADNLEDLDRMDRYLRARVRLGTDGTGYGPVPGETSLPDWMMTRDNQAELLTVIAHLRSTVA
ncbi:hypothetical protein AB0J72_26180 [Dactylosporangium sp. NPDC049742]|uniref:hypothetical protein n=1 Tax=Dactylosporangium sp. NPDC049742 TaxID=3154737 RepID=UPI00343A6BD1